MQVTTKLKNNNEYTSTTINPKELVPIVSTAGYSNIFASREQDPIRYIPVDTYYWIETINSAYRYTSINYSYTVPSGTAANTTYLVADNHVVKNFHNESSGESISTPTIRTWDINEVIVVPSLTITGATSDVQATILYYPAPKGGGRKEDDEFTYTHWKEIVGTPTSGVDPVKSEYSFGFVSANTTYNASDYDAYLRSFIFGDIALYIKVVSAPASDTTISLTGKAKISINQLLE